MLDFSPLFKLRVSHPHRGSAPVKEIRCWRVLKAWVYVVEDFGSRILSAREAPVRRLLRLRAARTRGTILTRSECRSAQCRDRTRSALAIARDRGRLAESDVEALLGLREAAAPIS